MIDSNSDSIPDEKNDVYKNKKLMSENKKNSNVISPKNKNLNIILTNKNDEELILTSGKSI